MNVGKTLFAQVMEFVPWKTFGRIIERHHGDSGVRTLGCADLFRVMAFAQLTWRESLRDIEVCLTANQAKLFHMGMRGVPARSTLADALNLRDWRIYHALAMRLILRARDLYARDPLDIGLDSTVYALDSTTIDLCLSLFDWAPFRSTKAAVKMLTQSMAIDLGADGIRCNALAPGVIETPMTDATRANPERLARFMVRIPSGRVGQPQELAGAAVFLASSLASYVNGVTLPVDGGTLAV